MNNKFKITVNKIKGKKYLLFLLFTIWVGLEYISAGPFSFIRIHDTGNGAIPLLFIACSNIFNRCVFNSSQLCCEEKCTWHG
jgi:hypothetical protein